jgi:carboxypeptidase Taq
MSAYDDLMAFQRKTEALSGVAGRLGWDQETMMPDGAADQRAEEHGAMANMLHGRRIDPRIGEWLETADPVDDVGCANLRQIKRAYTRTMKVPGALAAELAKTTSLAHRVWANSRADEDVASFLPMLSRVVELRKEEAAAVAGDADPYDALLDDYEPGATGAELGAMFDALRPRLVALRAIGLID